MRRGVEGARRREPALPVAQERDHRFELLGDDTDKVQAAVAVDVRRHEVDRTRARVEPRPFEHRRAPVHRPVAQERHLPFQVPTERGHREVEVAVPVDVDGFHVGHAGEPTDGERREAAAGQRAQPRHRALLVVAREELAEVGHEQVEAPVPVQVDHRHVIGVGDLGDGYRPAVHVVGVGHEDDSLSHVAGQDLRAPVAVEVGDTHVRHRGLGRDRVLERYRAPHEPNRTVSGRRPSLEWCQGRGGRRLVVREDRLIVGGERRRRHAFRAPLRDRLSGGDGGHLCDLAPPGCPGENVRRGERVAGRALQPRELLPGGGPRPPRRRADRSHRAPLPREDHSRRREGGRGEPCRRECPSHGGQLRSRV